MHHLNQRRTNEGEHMYVLGYVIRNIRREVLKHLRRECRYSAISAYMNATGENDYFTAEKYVDKLEKRMKGRLFMRNALVFYLTVIILILLLIYIEKTI